MNEKKITLSMKGSKLAVESEFLELPKWLFDILKNNENELIALLSPEDEATSGVEQRLKRLWTELTGNVPEHDTSFFMVAASSLDVIKLRGKIINEFNVDIPVNALYRNKAFIDQVRCIQRELARETLEE